MKYLITTIAAVVLVGCGGSVDINKAATKGDIAAIKQYLNAGNDVDARNESEWTVLMYAANNGRKEIAELLIAKGADVNIKDESGHTPLYAAASDGHREIAELLIAKGADVNAKERENGGTPLHWAAFRGRNEVAVFLIAEGADVNAKNKADATPLDKAIEKNRDDTVSLLREHGGKATKKSKPAEPVSEIEKPEPRVLKNRFLR